MAASLSQRRIVSTLAPVLVSHETLQKKRLPQIARQIRAGYARARAGEQEWIAGTLELAEALAAGRGQFTSNQKFGAWLANQDFKIGDTDRAALIGIGQNLDLARTVLEETQS